MSKSLENYEDDVYAEIKRNYNRAVRSGTPASRASRNANYRRSTAKLIASSRKSTNERRIRRGKLPRASWKNNSNTSGNNTNGNTSGNNTNGNTSGNNSNANSTGATVNNNRNKSRKSISWRHNVKPPTPAFSPLPVVACPRCKTHLRPPPGAPVFACPCGQHLEAPKLPPPPPPPPPPLPVATVNSSNTLRKQEVEKINKEKEEKEIQIRKELINAQQYVKEADDTIRSIQYRCEHPTLSSKPEFAWTGRKRVAVEMANANQELNQRLLKLIELNKKYIRNLAEWAHLLEIHDPTNNTLLPKLRNVISAKEQTIRELELKNSDAVMYYHKAKRAETDAKEECVISG